MWIPSQVDKHGCQKKMVELGCVVIDGVVHLSATCRPVCFLKAVLADIKPSGSFPLSADSLHPRRTYVPSEKREHFSGRFIWRNNQVLCRLFAYCGHRELINVIHDQNRKFYVKTREMSRPKPQPNGLNT